MRFRRTRIYSLATLIGLGCGCSRNAEHNANESASAHALDSTRMAPANLLAPSASAPSGTTSPGAPTDTLPTTAGAVEITPIHHAMLSFRVAGKVIYLDPTKEGITAALPKASHIFLTDIHPDHLDLAAIEQLRLSTTIITGPQAVADKLPGVAVLRNGEVMQMDGFSVEAIPMYNLQRGPAAGKLYHDKGRGNGYVFGFANQRIYVSGDTECTPEMRALRSIDVAFVCMNLPYTMPPSEAAECIRAFHPRIVYPYHYRGSDLSVLQSALAPDHSIEVRLRPWY